MNVLPQEPPPEGYLAAANWRFLDVLFVFVAGVVAAIVAGTVVVASGADPMDPVAFSAIFGAQALGSFVLLRILSKSRASGSLATDVGFVVNGSDWWGVPAGMGIQVAIAVVLAPLVFLLWPEGPPTQGVAQIAAAADTLAEQLAVLLAIVILAPIIEEIIFRGMLLSALLRSMSKWPAILVSAGIFSGIHLLDPDAIAVIPGLFLLGVVLGYVALKRGNLSLAIAMHSGINLLAGLALLYGGYFTEWAEIRIDELEQLQQAATLVLSLGLWV